MTPPWRNGLACWTSNSKVVGSSPTGGAFFLAFMIWLNPRAGKMKRILCSDWLPERAEWAFLARSGFPASVKKRKSFIFGQIINPLLT